MDEKQDRRVFNLTSKIKKSLVVLKQRVYVKKSYGGKLVFSSQ